MEMAVKSMVHTQISLAAVSDTLGFSTQGISPAFFATMPASIRADSAHVARLGSAASS